MDKVRLGIIGLGNIGTLHCGYMNELGNAELRAICDVDESKFALSEVEDFDHEAGGMEGLEDLSTFRDYEEMYQSGEIDAVIIGTPHYFHPPMTIDAFREGLHVLCEKPIAVTAKEARRMKEAHQETDLVFSAMFQKRTAPQSVRLKEMIEGGELGEIRRINWIKTDWFRTQTYYDSGGWRGNWNGEGGGVLTNQCPHDLDLFQWCFGTPTKLTALSYLGKWHDITVEDDISVLMEMENGATASFITSTGDAPGTDRLEVTAEKGKLVFEDGELTFHRLEEPLQKLLEEVDQSFYSPEVHYEDVEVEERPSGHRYITQNFVNSILDGEELIAPGEEGVESVQLANAMLYSGLRGEQVDFPVPEDEFVELLEELREKERKENPDKAFDWKEYLGAHS